MNERRIYKLIGGIFLLGFLIVIYFFYQKIFLAKAQMSDSINFVVQKDESISALAERLEDQGLINSAWFFKKYLVFKGVDKQVQAGEFTVKPPVTLARVVNALKEKADQEEKSITIIPGWDLRDIAGYFEKESLASSKEFYGLAGRPAEKKNIEPVYNKLLAQNFKVLKSKPSSVSLEGYIAPDTYRIFDNASLEDIIIKLVAERDGQFTDMMYADIKKSGHSVHEIITMASILEREVRSRGDKAKVADLFWRRYRQNWALQADSTVHYVSGKKGNVFTTKEDRDSLNEWNTYKYPGLPPGPISNPSLESIIAAIYPEPNNNFYFITTLEGVVKYAEDLDGHNRNVQKYLR